MGVCILFSLFIIFLTIRSLPTVECCVIRELFPEFSNLGNFDGSQLNIKSFDGLTVMDSNWYEGGSFDLLDMCFKYLLKHLVFLLLFGLEINTCTFSNLIVE